MDTAKRPKNNKFFNLDDYQIIPEAFRASFFSISELIANYCWQKHSLFPINTLTILQHKDNQWRVYWAAKKRDHFQKVLKRFMKNFSLLEKMENYLTNIAAAAVKHISSQPLGSLSDKKLGSLLMYYYLQLQDLHKAGMTLRLIDRGAREYFTEFFASAGESDKSNILSSSRRQAFATKENIALLKLAIKISQGLIKDNSAAYNKELKKIHDNFCWLALGYFNEPVSTLENYKKRLKLLVKNNPERALKNIIQHLSEMQAERKKILKKASPELKLAADIAAESSYLKDYFKFSSNKIQYFAEPIFQEISRRKKINVFDLKELAHQDAFNLIARGIANKPAVIKNYLRHTVFVSLTGKIRDRYVGAQADEFEKLYLTHEKNISGIFKGRTACRGIVKGRAKVVSSLKDFYKIKKGDIIIVLNTSPDYAPILSRVGAIVAEEGGITAHVSVISREMKIPCIVGISHATKEIKDGDYLEVNADKGEVRILKK